MEELIEKVAEQAGITEDQAKKAIESVKSFVVEKYPLLEGVVKNVFTSN
jgi:nucleoid DNA-binding protein